MMEPERSITLQPRRRQRIQKPAPALHVPDIEDDAFERKRVLNVLAQRRYRKRKRGERLQAGSTPRPESVSVETSSVDSADDLTTKPPCQHQPFEESRRPLRPTEPRASAQSVCIDPAPPSIDWDATCTTDLLSSAISLYSTYSRGEIINSPLLDNWSEEGRMALSHFDSMSSSTYPGGDVSSIFSFNDSYHLHVHELTTLRGILRIATRLNCNNDNLWRHLTPSPFILGTSPALSQLPTNLYPSPAQVSVPHHPLVDLLPWPAVRDRFIHILSLPDEIKPMSLRCPMILPSFLHDMEHNSEGIRIYGDDPYDSANWEVGQVMFEKWWHLFDRDIIENSNRWRMLRGAPRLSAC